MSAMQRNKGRAGEQEVASILRDWLGVDVTRNWQGQAAEGGADIAGVDGWSIEVKRAKADSRNAWWSQTVEQAERVAAKPILIFRIDGYGRGLHTVDKWQCVIQLADIGVDVDCDLCALITLRAWIQIVREQIGGTSVED